MKHSLPFLLLLAAACQAEPQPQAGEEEPPQPSGPPVVQQAEREEEAAAPAAQPASGWEQAGENGIRLKGDDGKIVLALSCAGGNLRATAPSFTPIGSEDRFSLGLGNEPVTLVADLGSKAPGVTAEGAAPANFEALLGSADQMSALYGTQQVGPVPGPSAALRQKLAGACAQ